MSEQEMVDSYITNRDGEEAQLTMDFAKEMLGHELQIKEIKDAMKEIKADAKSNGIAIKQVNAALAKLKKLATQNPLEAEEEDFLMDKFAEDVDISMMVSQLTAKD